MEEDIIFRIPLRTIELGIIPLIIHITTTTDNIILVFLNRVVIEIEAILLNIIMIIVTIIITGIIRQALTKIGIEIVEIEMVIMLPFQQIVELAMILRLQTSFVGIVV